MKINNKKLTELQKLFLDESDKYIFFLELVNIFEKRFIDLIKINKNDIVKKFMNASISKLNFSEYSESDINNIIISTYESFEQGMLSKYLPDKMNKRQPTQYKTHKK